MAYDESNMRRVVFHFVGVPTTVTADLDKDMLYSMLDQTENFDKPEQPDEDGELPSVSPTTYHTVYDISDGGKEIIMNMRTISYMEVSKLPGA